MNTFIKKLTISAALLMGHAVSAAVTVQDLLEQQKNIYTNLQDVWVDGLGNTRFSGKDMSAQFSFTPSMLDRMTAAQLNSSIDIVLSRFTADQKKNYHLAIDEELKKLAYVKIQLADKRKDMEEAAGVIGESLGKKAQEIMKLPDQNLKALISNLANSDKKIKVYTSFTAFSQLRKDFAVETVSVAGTTKSKGDGSATTDDPKVSKETLAAKQKIAQGVANTNFKISSMTGFIGESIKYGMCKDRHFDIVPDAEGLNFITEAR